MLQDVLSKAAESLGTFHNSADEVVKDEVQLAMAKAVNAKDAAQAQADVKAAIGALSDELAALPAPPPDPTPAP